MNVAVILISGKGKRMDAVLPKQYILVNDKPLYLYTLDKFYTHKDINYILLVCSEEYIDIVKGDINKYRYINKKIDVISGGEERYLSVNKALEYLNNNDCHIDDKILIHDGVRPNVSSRIISENISGLNIEPCALTAIKADPSELNKARVDTIHLLNQKYYRAQTPQSFRFGVIKQIYEQVININPYPFTDDISAAISMNYPYIIIDGEEENYKITTKEDLNRFSKE